MSAESAPSQIQFFYLKTQTVHFVSKIVSSALSLYASLYSKCIRVSNKRLRFHRNDFYQREGDERVSRCEMLQDEIRNEIVNKMLSSAVDKFD